MTPSMDDGRKREKKVCNLEEKRVLCTAAQLKWNFGMKLGRKHSAGLATSDSMTVL